ncbi:MAG TPA: uroporphyrinogen-III C-methyltransferase [Xanthomonadaceae bacterium]|nr:uroporphyrinogen-III C-methyltransferase [Xanthomonadaceae bacterium]
MSDPQATDGAPEQPRPATSAPASARPRRRAGAGLWLLLVLALAAVAVLGWRELERYRDQRGEFADWHRATASMERSIGSLQQGLDATGRTQRALAQRLDDAGATNKLLREELLAVSERSALLEDSIARLSEQRLRGEVLLKLNEAEFLLLMGAERLSLFGDVDGATQAYRLADATLASIDDLLAATLRETLAQELAALDAVPADGARRARAGLDAVAAMLQELPDSVAARRAVAPAGAGSRLGDLLAQVVTVRRVATGPDATDTDAIVDPAVRAAERTALSLDLAVARAAADRRDDLALNAALMRAQARIERLYDADDDRVGRVLQGLAVVAALELSPPVPALGATLRELRGVRAARSALPAAPQHEPES